MPWSWALRAAVSAAIWAVDAREPPISGLPVATTAVLQTENSVVGNTMQQKQVEALPVAALVEQMFGVLVAKGRGGWDHSALLTLLEEAAQHEIGEGG